MAYETAVGWHSDDGMMAYETAVGWHSDGSAMK